MRHGDKIKNLGRTQAHRRALMSNLTCQLIEHKRIVTTLAKARALRVYAEPLITRSKNDNMHNRRVVFSYLQDKEAIKELFGTIGDKVADRPGGYTRIIKMPRRMGDASDMAMIELVDFNEIYGKEAGTAASKKTRRSRRGGGGSRKTDTTITPSAVAPVQDITDEVVSNDEVASDGSVASEEAPVEQHDATASVSEQTGDVAAMEDTPNEDPARTEDAAPGTGEENVA